MIPYICITECSGIKFKTMWVIKSFKGDTNDWFMQSMYTFSDGSMMPQFDPCESHAFRFPDENTAFAVMAFLNRDNLEVTCLE